MTVAELVSAIIVVTTISIVGYLVFTKCLTQTVGNMPGYCLLIMQR